MPLNATMSDESLFTRPAALVEQRLHAMLDGCDLPPDLLEASRHGVLGGGKRLRPALVVLSCEAVEGETDRALPAAAALELVHCFSLVHDDLPALDDDELRRGQPTLHIRSGEAMAILAGDLMLTLARRPAHVVGDTNPELVPGALHTPTLTAPPVLAGRCWRWQRRM